MTHAANTSDAANRSAHARRKLTTACSACAGHYDCNIYVRTVASRLGIVVPGGKDARADEMIEAMRVHWRTLSIHDAILAAEQGAFVVAGLPSYEHIPNKDGSKVNEGHVCVVVPGKLGNYPRVFSTNTDSGPFGKSRGDQPLSGIVFKHADAVKVRYYVPHGASGAW